MNNVDNPKKPVILFIPEVGIYPYVRGLAILGDAITKKGGRVLITHDSGQMLRSPLMAMHKLPVDASAKEKGKVIKGNDEMFKKVLSTYNFSSIELSDFVDDKLYEEINVLIENTDDLENLIFKGFPVGKAAMYDFILEAKCKYSKHLSNDQKALYKLYIKNTALTVAITDTICKEYDPSLILTFNEYAQCQAARYGAHINGVPRMTMAYMSHYNADFSRFVVWEKTSWFWRYNHCQNWNAGKNVPIKSEYVDMCWNDAIFRLYGSGSHIFSPSKKNDTTSIFKKLELSAHKKRIIVYTSSGDERGGSEIIMKVWGEDTSVHDVFSDQIEWLLMLREYASKRDDVEIIVRIHPREGRRRDGFDSQHLKKLKQIFSNNTEYFIVIWPDNPISSYDLMELADVCLVPWSLMGQEAARLGIPVLSFTSNMYYPDDDFIQVATTLEEYKEKLDEMINFKFNWDHLVKAVRFYHWRILLPSLDFGDTVPADVQDDTIWPEASSNMVDVVNDVLSGKKDLIEYRIKKWNSSLPANALEQESEAMQKGIRFFLDKIFYPPISYQQKFGMLYRIYRKIRKVCFHIVGKKVFVKQGLAYSFVDYNLEFTDDVLRIEELCKRTKREKNLRIIVADGLYAIMLHKGKKNRRMSPMSIRLASLYHQKNNNCNKSKI